MLFGKSKISVKASAPERSVACYEFCIRAESIAVNQEEPQKVQPALYGNRSERQQQNPLGGEIRLSSAWQKNQQKNRRW